MKSIAFAAAALLLLASNESHAAKSGACPAGKITCSQWCARHWKRTFCMTGLPGSCDKKPGGANACVTDN